MCAPPSIIPPNRASASPILLKALQFLVNLVMETSPHYARVKDQNIPNSQLREISQRSLVTSSARADTVASRRGTLDVATSFREAVRVGLRDRVFLELTFGYGAILVVGSPHAK